MDPEKQVSNLINCLTDDEDHRQDLWIHYLSGNPPSSLASYLSKLKKESHLDAEFQYLLWQISKNPPSDKFKILLEYLSDIERSVICLLALGLTVSEISRYKGIAEIRIRQVISVVKENDYWKELYGVKDKVDRP